MRKLLLRHMVLPTASALTPFKSWALLQEMCAAEYEPLQRQRMHRMGLVRELLVHAYREVDLYRMALDRAHVDPVEVSYPRKLARVPTVRRADLREGFPELQLARSYRWAWLRYCRTSGTCGPPLLLIQDTRDLSYKYASLLRARLVGGADPLAREVRLLTRAEGRDAVGLREPAWRWAFGPNRSVPSRRTSLFRLLEERLVDPLFHRAHYLEPFWTSNQLRGPVDLDAYLARLERLRPDVLTIDPIHGLLLARHLRRTGRVPPPVGIVNASGGLCTSRMATLIGEAFDARVIQSVGGCGLGRYAASCPEDPARMHIPESFCYVEAVRADRELCAPGELGNLVATSLHSFAMPLIRYETEDIGRIIEEPCTCGRRSRRLEHAGRVQELLRNADGRWVTGAEVLESLFGVPGLELFQLSQRAADAYELKVVADSVRPLDEDALQATLEALLGARANVATRRVSHILPERSGKIQLVKSTTYRDFCIAPFRGRRR